MKRRGGRGKGEEDKKNEENKKNRKNEKRWKDGEEEVKEED